MILPFICAYRARIGIFGLCQAHGTPLFHAGFPNCVLMTLVTVGQSDWLLASVVPAYETTFMPHKFYGQLTTALEAGMQMADNAIARKE